jgi:sugar phosphate isomerase/epimerase
MIDRRDFLRSAAILTTGCFAGRVAHAADDKKPVERGKATKFQIACMTLPYSAFPLERALTGLKSAGYSFVAWGTSHKEDGGKPVPVLAGDAPPEKAKDLAKRCRDLGMEPVMMFGPNPENVAALKQRIAQAAAAGVPQILTMGSTRGNDAKVWAKNFKELGPIARDNKVTIVVKQHGGNTGTGAALFAIVHDVADDNIRISYDAGNVMDYHKIKDVIPDLEKCASEIRSFCIKDHRLAPKDEDCGPGFGQIDHYKLLAPVAFTGLTIPLCCENISAPLLPRPDKPEGVDALARRAREYLETVTQGLQA